MLVFAALNWGSLEMTFTDTKKTGRTIFDLSQTALSIRQVNRLMSWAPFWLQSFHVRVPKILRPKPTKKGEKPEAFCFHNYRVRKRDFRTVSVALAYRVAAI